jgi:hypothetical protein
MDGHLLGLGPITTQLVSSYPYALGLRPQGTQVAPPPSQLRVNSYLGDAEA